MSCNKRIKNDEGALQPSAAAGAGSGDFNGGDRGHEPRPVVGTIGRGVDALSIDAMAIVFGFLDWKDILRARVCRKWKEAAICTDVPPTFTDHHGRFIGWERRYEFRVDSPRAYNILVGLTKALPNLQQIELKKMQYGVDDEDTYHKFGEGDDAVEFVWIRDNGGCDRRPEPPMRRYDVHIIGAFRKLRSLHVTGDPLNGRYPRLFAGFSSLQKLHIERNQYLKWDIGMLAGTPQLKELVYSEASGNMCEPKEPLTGNIGDFRVVKCTLEVLKLHSCSGISGDYRGLANFPCLTVLDTSAPVTGCIGGESIDWMEPGSFPNLEVLNLWSSKLLTGDLRRMQVEHFPKLQKLRLGYGNRVSGFDRLERIGDATGIMQALHPLKKRSPSLFTNDPCDEKRRDVYEHGWRLVAESPDWYESEPTKTSPPFRVVFVQAGSRLGWQWVNNDWRSTSGCEVNWLDPEPCENTDEYAEYTEELKSIQGRINVYKGFYSPPTQEEYKRVCVDFEPDYGNSESSNDEDEDSRFYDSEYNSDY